MKHQERHDAYVSELSNLLNKLREKYGFVLQADIRISGKDGNYHLEAFMRPVPDAEWEPEEKD